MAEMGWVRQLAGALVKNDALADDVAQDAWLVAAKQSPDPDRPLRPWLARVVLNLVRTRRTADARRERRHAAAGDDRDVPTPAELVERVELHRALADEVLVLAEPYRTTVLLHFFEGYSSADIARRLGIPDGTVRRRLKVGLDQLRDALGKRKDQPRGGWLAALIPFAKLPEPHVPAAIGVIAMKKVLLLVAMLLVLLLIIGVGGTTLWRRHTSGEASTTSHARSTLSNNQAAGTSLAHSAMIPEWLVKPGAPRRRIAGRVEAFGKPVAGAHVVLGFEVFGEPSTTLVMPDSTPKVLQTIAEVTSAPDGTFDFGEQPPVLFTVSAAATNLSPAQVVLDNANPRVKSDMTVLRLGACGSRLFGVVADASGGGIAKAQLFVAGLAGTESDASGKYSVCLAPREAMSMPNASVRVEADGYGTTVQTVLVEGDLHHDFLLVPEAVLTGRVTTSDGEPVDGARVIAAMEPSEIPHHLASRWTYADADGRFRISGLAPGAFQLIAAAKGLTAPPIAVVARAAKTSPEIRIVLQRNPVARVRGHVFKKGTPVGGAFLMAVQGDKFGGTTISQADGSFVLDGIPYGKTKLVAAPNQQPTDEIDVSRPLVDDVRVDITGAAMVRGHVTRHGKPVDGADVAYTPALQTTLYGPPPMTRTDETGAYMLELPAGVGQIIAWDNPGKAYAEPHAVEVTSTDDKVLDIDLDASGEVQGIVVDQTGSPVRDAYVRFDLADGRDDICESLTDAAGRFDCPLLLGGEYRPTVTPAPGVRQGFAPAAGEQFATIQVPRDGVVTGIQLAIKDERVAIRGTVVDDTGAIVPDVQIEAIARVGDYTMDPVSTLSDFAGHFEITNLAPGRYTLSARAADASEGELPDVETGGQPVTLRLARAGGIEGTLVGFSSTPVVLIMSPEKPDLAHGGRAIVDGARFSRIGLSPGRYTVDAIAGTETDGQAVEIRPGETSRIELHARGTGKIEGSVSELVAHTPIAGMRCDSRLSLDGMMSPPPPDPSQQAFADATGHFVVNAPIGRVRLFCFSTNGGLLSPAGIDVEVTAGAAAKATVFSVRATPSGSPGSIGLMLTPNTLPLTVGALAPGGPAAVAGVHTGDQVTSVDGLSLHGVVPEGVMVLIMNHKPGSTVTLGISRAGVERVVKVGVIAGP